MCEICYLKFCLLRKRPSRVYQLNKSECPFSELNDLSQIAPGTFVISSEELKFPTSTDIITIHNISCPNHHHKYHKNSRNPQTMTLEVTHVVANMCNLTI